MFNNIDNLYTKYKERLLKDDSYRPCKSVPRSIANAINKFKDYYLINKEIKLTEFDVLRLLELNSRTDTYTTNIRAMREFGFLKINSPTEYELLPEFINYVNGDEDMPELLLDRLYRIRSIEDITMYLNTVLCTLREGYLNGKIIEFPQSESEFNEKVPNKNERIKYCQNIYEIYGFKGKNKEPENGDYSPCASQRVLTEIRNLNLIKQSEDIEGMKTYVLTDNGLHLLRTIDRNLEKVTIIAKNSKNIIFYGVPGCGKSYKIEHEILPQSKEDRENVFRTTFYLDYTNSDFIGQIYPSINDDGTVEYKHVPGPFTKALERSLRYKDKTVYLVIEEINRGNAAAIFGDLFQLLDRLDLDYDGRNAGDSEYPVSNEFIEGYFESRNRELEDYKIDYIKGKLYIPHNMIILATMNTSDQNVFPLDTAFKRRWKRERVVSDWSDENNLIKEFIIPGTEYTWEAFAKGINKMITENSKNTAISEDKCLGSFFVNESMLLTPDDTKDTRLNKLIAFFNNVVDYLYNDVTKFDHELIFKKEANSFEKMYKEMMDYNFDGTCILEKWFNSDSIKKINEEKKNLVNE